jgi:hypothetical protein
LVAQGLSAVSLHGGRSQSERESALHNFRSSSTSILVISSALLEHNILTLSVHCLSSFCFSSLASSVVLCNTLSRLITTNVSEWLFSNNYAIFEEYCTVKPGVASQDTVQPALACCIS